MEFKENKWYNLGDVNPRVHGGVFVKRVGNDIEVVETMSLEDAGGKGYTANARSDYVDYLLSRFEYFKKDPDNKCENNSVGSFADWKRFIQMEKDGVSLDDIVFYLAADMISYYGGDSEGDTDTNYWDMLGIHGITYRNYI